MAIQTWKRAGLTLAVIALVACATAPKQPAPVVSNEPIQVSASFNRTWDAVIDNFATDNIPIRTIEKASGIIATERLRVPHEASTKVRYAECKTSLGLLSYGPTHASYNVLVRGDSTASTAKITVLWTYINPNGRATECQTKDIWETSFEQSVKTRAEGAK